MTHTYTKTHVTEFADPFLACATCGGRVRWRDHLTNMPCEHQADFNSVCPSWSPVDGCLCQEQLGSVNHGVPK